MDRKPSGSGFKRWHHPLAIQAAVQLAGKLCIRGQLIRANDTSELTEARLLYEFMHISQERKGAALPTRGEGGAGARTICQWRADVLPPAVSPRQPSSAHACRHLDS
jgi:hypothetical protein